MVLVAAAALVDADNRVLIAQRPEGKAMAGLWEFPGGKVEAGERLRSDFELAGMTPRLVRGYDASPVSGGRRSAPASPDPTSTQIDAHRRLDAAVAAAGPGLSDVLIRVCCFLEGLEEAERQLGWPTRSAKVVLSIALDRLADHYAGQKKKGARRRPNGKGMPARVRL